jgi:hypothetical protein
LIAFGEILFGQQKQVATKRLSRVMLYLGMLITQTQAMSNGSKFMQGTLFSMGGLMKIEARNYLFTKHNTESDFKLPAPIKDNDPDTEDILQRAKRDLTKDDIKFFENGFITHLVNFIKTLRDACQPLTGI